MPHCGNNTKMWIGIVYVGVCLVAIVWRKITCDAITIHNSTSGTETSIAELFPQDIEFNESCVAEGCPALKNISLCPSHFEIKSLRNMNEILKNCMRGPICGIIIDRRPLKSLVVSMKDFLPGLKIDGISTIFPDTCNISNISNIQLEIVPNENQHLPFQVTMMIHNLRFYGRFQMDLRMKTVFGPTLTASLNESSFDAGIDFICTVLANKTTNGANVDIRIVNPIVKAHAVFCGTDMPSGFPDIQSLLTSNSQIIFEKSSMAKAMANFLEKLFQAAAQVASNNCKQLK